MSPRVLLLPHVALVLLIVFGWIIVNATEQHYIPDRKLCYSDSGQTFSDGSIYQVNRDKLVHDLCTGAVSNRGFFNLSWGDSADRVFGVAMCYVASTWTDCEKCLKMAPSYVSTACPNGLTGGLIYGQYGRCIIRYSDQDFAGLETDGGADYHTFLNIYVDDTVTMNKSRWRMMEKLIPKAVESRHRYANGSELYKGSIRTYGLLQCRMDLSPKECDRCLKYHVQYLLGSYVNNTGASIAGFGCYAQYHPEPIILMSLPGEPAYLWSEESLKIRIVITVHC